MGIRANSSRERILTAAEGIILQNGFAGTSIDEILDQAAITKGGFFYHFNGKAELAKALINRYLEQDSEIFNQLFAKADSLSEDPLHALLIFLKLFAEMMSDLGETHPGCLVAGFTYESQQFNEEVRELIKQGVLSWRSLISARLERVVERYELREEVTLDDLADMFTAVIEGGIILSRILKDNQPLVKQVLLYRSHLRLVFGDIP